MKMPVRTYSSGMRSKLAFGLSLAIGFEFYLIDEAFSVGDITFREKAKKEIARRTADSSLIFVSHSIQSVKEHCNCGAVLHKSKLTYYAKLDDAISHYTEICNGTLN
jgi:capsular polysaccharide transport system ATP-binding protein